MDSQLKFILIDGLQLAEGRDIDQLIFIPKPKSISIEKEIFFRIRENILVSFINVNNIELLFNNLVEHLQDYTSISLEKTEMELNDSSLLSRYNRSDLVGLNNQESYNLEISNSKIVIYSTNEKGLFYGIQTFIQIIKNSLIKPELSPSKDIIIPSLIIKDCPDLIVRGVAQDISRGQVCTVENAKRYIKILSHYKMNFYCLYFEDMFAHPDHPLIGKDRGALTSDEIREIDVYAREHFVELVPIFECLGHFDNILQHKNYQHLGEFPGAHSLDISNPDIYPFLRDYISEMSKCFSTDYFHIGCDESFDVGKYKSKNYIEKHGQGKVMSDFYNQIFDITSEYGNKNIIMYDDMVRKDEEILNRLNRDMILMYWEYNPDVDPELVEKFLDAGHKVIVSPSMLNWNRNFPDSINASKNIINMVDIAYKYSGRGCLGILTSTWGDQRYFSLRENEIFGAIITADKAWNVKVFDYKRFKQKFGFLFYGLEEKYLQIFNELYTHLSSSAEYYYRLRMILPPLFYTDFFKHPFPAKKFKPGLKKYEELRKLGDNCIELYKQILPKVKFEKTNFGYIEFGAELAKYCGEKIKFSVQIADTLRNSNLSKDQINEIIKNIEYIREKIKYLKQKYESLWLNAAKRPCLDYNLQMFDYLIKAYNEKITQLKNNIFFKNPFLESEWIGPNERTCPKKFRFFRKRFELRKPINRALIQTTVCNHMKIYVNREYVGEVLGRFSLSRLPIILRVQVFDITEHLKKGENIIAIEAISYEGFKGAFNLFGQIELEDGSIIEILSDELWVYSKKQIYNSIEEWKSLEFKDSSWEYVKSYGPPPNLNGDLKKPDLLKGDISLTQNYFGAQGYYFSGIEIFFGRIVRFLLKYLIGFIVRRAKLFG
jgi:hypothetical protein